MQDKYTADITDFFKFLLLRNMARNWRTNSNLFHEK